MWLADSSHWLAHYGWQGFAAATHIVQWPDGRLTGGSAIKKSGAGSLRLLLSEQGWAWFFPRTTAASARPPSSPAA